MLGIIISAHNEAGQIKACILAVKRAAIHPALECEATCIVVAIDACSDDTATLALACGADVVLVDAKNLGIARAAGALPAIDQGAHWLAFTDADTLVAEDWLLQQLRCDADAVWGVISVKD